MLSRTQRRAVWLMLLAALLVLAPAAFAQNAVSGPVATIDGDLYQWNDGTANQLTTYGYNGQPVQSFEGNLVAYRSRAEDSLGGQYAGEAPQNIWVLDRRTGDFTQVANATDGLRFRSVPVWSPQGEWLAWVEEDVTSFDGTGRLVTYNHTTGLTSVVTENFNLGAMDGGVVMPAIQWGGAGVSILRYGDGNPGPGPVPIRLEIWDTDTGTLSTYPVGSTVEDARRVVDYVWLTPLRPGESAAVALAYADGTWQQMAPPLGTRSPLARPPAKGIIFGLSSAYVMPLARPQPGGGLAWRWQGTLYADGTMDAPTDTLPPEHFRLSQGPALGSDQVVWTTAAGLFSWGRDGVVRQLIRAEEGTNGVVWSPTVWEANPRPDDPLPLPGDGRACPLPPRLMTGQLAVVLPGPPNNLRAAPNLEAAQVGSLPEGTSMRVLAGPVCADGFNWFQVEAEGTTGWTAEGGDSEYWLQPSI